MYYDRAILRKIFHYVLNSLSKYYERFVDIFSPENEEFKTIISNFENVRHMLYSIVTVSAVLRTEMMDERQWKSCGASFIMYYHTKLFMGKEQDLCKPETRQESLQPQRISKEEKAYQSVLDIEERLRKGDATNIAITGPYGSGKSSIILSLKEDYPSYKYLNISLATLRPFIGDDKPIEQEDGDDEDDVSKQNLDRLIEYSILQQLIYREKQETLPDSRLKRIFHLSKKKVSRIAITTLFAFLALVVVFEPSVLKVGWLCRVFDIEWLNILGDSISLVYLTWFAYKALKIVVQALSNSRLNKVNIKSGEIEIVENTSIFNKHLDEILYFFEKTDYNVVILEDLDRFKSISTFLKLRELNLLLNESKVVNRRISFIYAVRDDLFMDEDRVKCFDYITTVIPVINTSNAKDKLKEELAKRGVTEIDDSKLRELGLFLGDMRLLKNIANEYVQYRSRLERGINCEKLLGMIIYKNYYPQDFANLHDCNGKLYRLLNLKDAFIDEKIKVVEKDNEQKLALKQSIIRDRHLREVELRRLYLEAYRDRLPNPIQSVIVGENSYGVKDVANNEKLFDEFIASPLITYNQIIPPGSYRAGLSQRNNASIPFTEIENAVDPSRTYRQRLEAIRASFEELDSMNSPIIKTEDIRSQPLSKIMAGIDYRNYPSYKVIGVPQLIEFLVLNGYLDESYYDYISYFYASFIDRQDRDFVLEVRLEESHPYDYKIHNVEACLSELPKEVFRKKAILNIDVVDYLAANQNNRLDVVRLGMIIKTIVNCRKYDFLTEYYEKGRYQDVVYRYLFSQYKELWNDFEKNDNELNHLKLIWFKYAEDNLSCTESIEWLSKHFEFITDHLLEITDEHWCELIHKRRYMFDILNGASGMILREVADSDAYALTKNNVEVLVSELLGFDCKSVSYRFVLETRHKQLIERVEGELGFCLKSVFSAPEAEKETEHAIVKIVCSSDVSKDEKVEYLSRQQNRIVFDSIDSDENKTMALDCNVIEPTWESIIHYMNNVSGQKLFVPLIVFIDKNADILAATQVPSENDKNERMLLEQLIETDTLPFTCYSKIIEQFKTWEYSDFVPSIEVKRMLLMIDYGMILFTRANLESLVNNYPANVVVDFLMKNRKEYINQANIVSYSTDIAIGLMKSGLSLREKADIIPHFDKDILNDVLSNEIIKIMNVRDIKITPSFLLRVMKLSNMTEEKINIIINILNGHRIDDDTISSLLNTLPEPYKVIAVKGKKPEIPKNQKSKHLVSVLKDAGFISSFSETKNGIRVNTRHK